MHLQPLLLLRLHHVLELRLWLLLRNAAEADAAHATHAAHAAGGRLLVLGILESNMIKLLSSNGVRKIVTAVVVLAEE